MHWMNVSYTTKFACLNAKTLYYWFKIGSQSTLKLGIANYIIVQNGCKYPHFQLFYNKPFVCLYKGVILSVIISRPQRVAYIYSSINIFIHVYLIFYFVHP